MSWTGTVRCGVCYKSGHNKSGCPRIAQEYKEYQDLIAKYNADNPDEPDIKEGQGLDWDTRAAVGLSYKHLRAKDVIQTKKRKNTTRQCTYCGDVGHNRRTCPPLKSHVDRLVKASALYNAKVAKAFELSGLYVGALIQYMVEEYDHNKCEWVKENRMGIVSVVNLQSYTVLKYLFSDYQSHSSIKVRSTTGKTTTVRPDFPSNVKEELFIGTSWGTSSGYTLLSSKDTPVPPHVFDEKEERKRIKGYLKDVNQRQIVSNLEDKLKTLSGDL
jgi:hypothetical protein